MTAKKIADNLDTGLWVDYGDDYRAAAWFDLGGYEDGGSYIIQYHKRGFPPFKAERFQTVDELIIAMREVQPDLRRWNTRWEL